MSRFWAERKERLLEELHEAEEERNHAFAFLRFILDVPYDPLTPGVLEEMKKLVTKGDEDDN
jgi:hypothetical protein